MIKLLKIACFFAVIACISAIVFAGLGFYRGNDDARDRQEFLESPTIIDKFKKLTNVPQTSQEKESPLVVQARALGLRLDPPPPPSQPKKLTKTNTSKTRTISERIQAPAPPSRNARFKLVGTCRYDDHPEKSLALLDINSPDGLRWVRQGDVIELHTIHKINDGSVIVYQNGKFSSELFMPPDNSVKTLLSDAPAKAEVPQANNEPVVTPAPANRAVPVADTQKSNRHTSTAMAARQAAIEKAKKLRGQSQSTTPATKTSAKPDRTRHLRNTKTATTPQQQQHSNEDSIAAVKNKINEISSSSDDPHSIKNDIEIFNELLKLLEEEKTKGPPGQIKEAKSPKK